MRKIIIALLLTGCGTDPTLGDAVDDLAAATCGRWVRCGWTADEVEMCVEDVRTYYCQTLDCSAAYEPGPEFAACLEEYETISCSDISLPCTLE